MVPFSMTLSDLWPTFQGHGVIIDALDVLRAQLTRDLFAMAKFLLYCSRYTHSYCEMLMGIHSKWCHCLSPSVRFKGQFSYRKPSKAGNFGGQNTIKCYVSTASGGFMNRHSVGSRCRQFCCDSVAVEISSVTTRPTKLIPADEWGIDWVQTRLSPDGSTR